MFTVPCQQAVKPYSRKIAPIENRLSNEEHVKVIKMLYQFIGKLVSLLFQYLPFTASLAVRFFFHQSATSS